jgi:hypothetical protein
MLSSGGPTLKKNSNVILSRIGRLSREIKFIEDILSNDDHLDIKSDTNFFCLETSSPSPI